MNKNKQKTGVSILLYDLYQLGGTSISKIANGLFAYAYTWLLYVYFMSCLSLAGTQTQTGWHNNYMYRVYIYFL